MIYPILMIFGFIGLVVMALMGSIRAGGHHGGARLGGARGGQGVARGGHGAHGGHGGHGARGAARGGHAPHAHGARSLGAKAKFLLPGLSPIDLMAMAMGAGAMGIIGRKVLHNEVVAALMAIGGAIVIDVFIVRPLFNLMMRFASDPSTGLEGMISQLAEAATGFDSQGRGLIKLTLDGQTSQVLATLEQGELASGIKVKKGDPLVVLEVDAARNVCRVSREIASSD